MKRKLLYFLLLIICVIGFSEDFNYYYRNEFTGSFILKNIEDLPSEYKLKYESNEDNIIGYYYNSDRIKFVDRIINNHIEECVKSSSQFRF